jgi:DNA-binding NarL/FixJ family response regulator
MEKISIMIVDDHTLIRETWSFLLGRNERFEVAAECGDGQQAIMMAKEKRPEVVLLDINMAPMNGFEILKQLKKYSPTSKVIGVSMHTQPTYAKKMLKLGARGYVTKNSPRKEMLDAIVEVYKGSMYICSEVKNILSEQVLISEEEPTGLNYLSEREIDVINFLKDGFSSKEIAQQLKISVKTIEVHRHHILKKLKVKNTASLINYINTGGGF